MIVVIGCVLVGSLPVAAETYTLRLLQGIAWAEYKVAEVKGLWENQGVTVKWFQVDHRKFFQCHGQTWKIIKQ